MSGRTAGRVAWCVWGACLVLLAISIVLTALNRQADTSRAEWESGLGVGFWLLFLAFATAGALIASRHRRNPIGWILLALGLAGFASSTGEGYAIHALRTDPGSLPAGEAAAWLVAWTSGASSITLLGIALVLFPGGTLPSPRWRVVLWAGFASLFLIFVWGFAPGQLDTFGAFELQNPAGIEGADFLRPAGAIGFVLALLVLAVGLTAVVRRLRRAHGDERQQLKWITLSGLAMCLVMVAGPVIWSIPSLEESPLWSVLFLVGVGSLPVTIAIAILRHRLYDIDVVIRRTVVYGVLTALLAATYIGAVLLLQLVLSPVTEGSSLSVALSTLAVAAAFRPARRQVQALVDRRFYRRRYDAERTLDSFGMRLRDQVDLDALGTELAAVVRESMQPAHVSVWLREARL